MEAYINRIATAVPPHDIHGAFLEFAEVLMHGDQRNLAVFRRLADRAGIDHRYSYLSGDMSGQSKLSATEFYKPSRFPGTRERMRVFEEHAPLLAQKTVERLNLGEDRDRISHLILTCCTGFSAPGLDFEIMARCGLRGSVERTIVGFMGCYAAMNGLKLARHIVRSEKSAKVLVVNLELCTVHLQETANLDQILSFMIFADGCAASLVSAAPVGLAMESFHAVHAPQTAELIQWKIGDTGFDMVLSGQVPAAIQSTLREKSGEILRGLPFSAIDHWAVHPGGRSVLDAVERGLDLPPAALAVSRDVLRRYGNMSSATVMFVLQNILAQAVPGSRGCAMSFGPGLVAETMQFQAGERPHVSHGYDFRHHGIKHSEGV
jgi:predicted naringenin-chalcone synthase